MLASMFSMPEYWQNICQMGQKMALSSTSDVHVYIYCNSDIPLLLNNLLATAEFLVRNDCFLLATLMGKDTKRSLPPWRCRTRISSRQSLPEFSWGAIDLLTYMSRSTLALSSAQFHTSCYIQLWCDASAFLHWTCGIKAEWHISFHFLAGINTVR